MLKMVEIKVINDIYQAVNLADNNYRDIAEWCGGTVIIDEGIFVEFKDANGDMVQASGLQWIVNVGSKFIVMKNVHSV